MSAPGNVRKAESTRSDWATPWPVFEALDAEFRFTVDAAASAENRKCERYLTEEEDALKADMIDQVVFINPPYGAGLIEWIAACAGWSSQGSTVVALLPSCTETAWLRLAWETAHEIRLVYPRVNFVGTKSGNTAGSLIVVWRPGPAVPMPRMYPWTWKTGAAQ